MEIIAEALLGLIVEVILPIIGEIAFEVLLRCLGEPFVSREYRNALAAGAGYFLIGLILGGFSVLIFPRSFVRSERFHGISLLITPVVSGLVMSAMDVGASGRVKLFCASIVLFTVFSLHSRWRW